MNFGPVTPLFAGAFASGGPHSGLCHAFLVVISTANAVAGVSEPPVCRLVVERIEVHVDESVEFQCIASGDPRPRIEWSRPRGRRLPPHAVVDDGYLRIPRVRKEDEGDYICTATNSAGEDYVTGVLIVREEAGELVLSITAVS